MQREEKCARYSVNGRTVLRWFNLRMAVNSYKKQSIQDVHKPKTKATIEAVNSLTCEAVNCSAETIPQDIHQVGKRYKVERWVDCGSESKMSSARVSLLSRHGKNQFLDKCYLLYIYIVQTIEGIACFILAKALINLTVEPFGSGDFLLHCVGFTLSKIGTRGPIFH